MPRPRIASATSAPMSGSSVCIGCAPASTTVTVPTPPVQRFGQLEADVAAADHDDMPVGAARRDDVVAEANAVAERLDAVHAVGVDAGQRRADRRRAGARSRGRRTAR